MLQTWIRSRDIERIVLAVSLGWVECFSSKTRDTSGNQHHRRMDGANHRTTSEYIRDPLLAAYEPAMTLTLDRPCLEDPCRLVGRDVIGLKTPTMILLLSFKAHW